MIDPQVFIKAWKESASPAEAGSKLGLKRSSAITMATTLRGLGYDVPKKQQGNPQWQKKK